MRQLRLRCGVAKGSGVEHAALPNDPRRPRRVTHAHWSPVGTENGFPLRSMLRGVRQREISFTLRTAETPAGERPQPSFLRKSEAPCPSLPCTTLWSMS